MTLNIPWLNADDVRLYLIAVILAAFVVGCTIGEWQWRRDRRRIR